MYIEPSQSGFTLVELITTLVIIGVLSSVAAPRFIGNDAFAARGAYGTLLSSLRLAQKTAIAQRTSVFANINTTTGAVCLGYIADCTSPITDPATKSAYIKSLPATVTLTSSRNPIEFTPSGQEASNNTITLTVTNNKVSASIPRIITIEQETGYVH